MKLPKLQLHLATCVALMFVAGGIIKANLNVDRIYETPGERSGYECWGWPLELRKRYILFSSSKFDDQQQDIAHREITVLGESRWTEIFHISNPV